MKVVLLAGGFGSRISEESILKPKPMIEIGGKPILWHIMKIYSHYGFNEFIICCGYKGYYIKEYFHHYYMHQSDVTIDLSDNKMEYHNSKSDPWKITLVDTGLNTMTGGRLQAVRKYIGDETFMMTYGDGVAKININELLDCHKQIGKMATMTAVQPAGRFGSLDIENGIVKEFKEKPKGDNSWINGGFFVLEPAVFNYIQQGADTIWERDPLENLAKDNELNAYKSDKFWKPMDTLRDKIELEKMWESGEAEWKVWQ